MEDIKLTSYSHGAGCGCKISPGVLDKILHTNQAMPDNDRLLVGNNTRDDAAAYDLGNGTALIATTDFFMPIVDDPFDFGRIAAANAISDVYAMGGRPVLALAVLGWPISKLAPEIAGRVIDGARAVCQEANVSLAGGHSIESPEPIFGLAVNGLAQISKLKRNAGARVGDLLYLTKPLGIGILTTAEKKGLLLPEHAGLAAGIMTRLNRAGARFAELPAVNAMTDVTGFGLLGHLREMCEASDVCAEIDFDAVPLIADLDYYLERKAIPGGTHRNWADLESRIGPLGDRERLILADPQTSGGLLVALDPLGRADFESALAAEGLSDFARPIGRITKRSGSNRDASPYRAVTVC